MVEELAVIILTKNNFKYIKQCLDSFNIDVNVCFYIGDTGSTEDVISEMEQYFKKSSKKIKLACFKYYNFAKNNNYIAKNLLGDEKYILFCNDDIVINEFNYDKALELLDRETTGTVGVKLLFENNTIQHAGQMINIEGDLSLGHILYKQPDVQIPTQIVRGNTGAFCFIRRDNFNTVGGFNQQYTTCFEDVELNLQMLLIDKCNILIGDCKCYHYESVSRNREETYINITDYHRLNKFINQNRRKLNAIFQNYEQTREIN